MNECQNQKKQKNDIIINIILIIISLILFSYLIYLIKYQHQIPDDELSKKTILSSLGIGVIGFLTKATNILFVIEVIILILFLIIK